MSTWCGELSTYNKLWSVVAVNRYHSYHCKLHVISGITKCSSIYVSRPIEPLKVMKMKLKSNHIQSKLSCLLGVFVCLFKPILKRQRPQFAKGFIVVNCLDCPVLFDIYKISVTQFVNVDCLQYFYAFVILCTFVYFTMCIAIAWYRKYSILQFGCLQGLISRCLLVHVCFFKYIVLWNSDHVIIFVWRYLACMYSFNLSLIWKQYHTTKLVFHSLVAIKPMSYLRL